MDRDFDREINIFFILLVLTIIGLKIAGVIQISWLWLLSPLWVTAGLGVVGLIGVTIICIVSELINKIQRRKNNERY